MNPVAYFPGKLGDAILQWPVARAWSQKIGKKLDIWADEKTCKQLVPLWKAQPEVAEVELKNQTQHYQCGGQPWDGGFPTEVHAEREIVSFGLRAFPTRQITLQTLHDVPLELGKLPDESQFEVGSVESANRVVLHGTFASHMSGVPGFWKFLYRVRAELSERFEQVVFVGTPAECHRAVELYPSCKQFDDKGDFLRLGNYLAGSRLVIGSGSCVAALAGALRVPCVRVHDPIGEAPRVIWSNLGANQINETERDLRKAWPKFRDAHIAKLVSV